MTVLKANAYGHDSIMIARQAEADGVEILGTANLPEAVKLREGGIKLPVLILSGIADDQVSLFLKHDFSTVVYSMETADILCAATKKKR